MYLNVNLNKTAYKKIRKDILDIYSFITLWVRDNVCYIYPGIKEKYNAYYFGKFHTEEEMYQLIPFDIMINKDKLMFSEYKKEAKRFKKEGELINKIEILDA